MSIFCENTNIFWQFFILRIKQPDEKKCINHIILSGIFALANNLGNFLRRLALPKKIKDWSLRSGKKTRLYSIFKSKRLDFGGISNKIRKKDFGLL